MPDEKEPVTQAQYERLPDEPSRWYGRFLLYRNLGSNRSLLGAVNAERVQNGLKPFNGTPSAWLKSFHYWNWKERASSYDKVRQAEQEAREAVYREYEAAEREHILTTGYALMEKRIEALTDLYDTLKGSFVDQETGKIEYKWVTPDKFRELRGCLDDIAKELGHRVKKTEVTGKDGGPLEIVTEWGGGKLNDDSEAEN